MTRYMLMSGLHSEDGKTYTPKDVIETGRDLTKFNSPGLPPKFELLDENNRPVQQHWRDEPVAQDDNPVVGTLRQMTVEQLREVAADEEVDLGDARLKEEIVKLIADAHMAGV